MTENEMQVNLAEKLVKHCSFADKAFFTNSGTEANEAAIKFARKFARIQGAGNACIPLHVNSTQS